MLKRLRDELSEKTKLIVYICITAAVFITACLLPLAFAGRGEDSGFYFDKGARAAMFLDYQSGSKEISSKVLDSLSSADEKFCSSKFSQLKSLCRIDGKNGKVITEGREYILLSDGDRTMRLCRMWLQDEGDWTNWMDVYFDADTGFVYYLYVSSICLSNGGNYLTSLEDGFNAKTVAGLIAQHTGDTLKHFSWSGNAEDSAYAVMGTDGDTVCRTINCTYYPATMLDIKISVA